jgi:hypothetical protein
MGWAYNNKRHRAWTDEDLADPLNRRLAGMGIDGVYGRPPGRSSEANARTAALRDIGYRGPVDQDGYAAEGPGTLPRVFSARPGRRIGWDDSGLEAEAWAWGRFDGGWDGRDGGEDCEGETWPDDYPRSRRRWGGRR